MNIITIFESAHTDGYQHFGDGSYFISVSDAVMHGRNRHGAYAVDPLEHPAIQDGNDFYLLKKAAPVAIANSEREREQFKAAALKKLTAEERELLGL